MERHMPEPTAPGGEASSATNEDRAIRQRVRELTSQLLQQGRLDTEAVRDVVRAVTSQRAGAAAGATEGRESFADAVRALDEALVQSAGATHKALQRLASRGQDFTDNDVKEALASLRQLERDYVAVVSRIAETMSGNLRREMTELAAQARAVGTEASARVASMMGEFASRMGESAASGLETMRGTGIRMALLASGVLEGVADALRDQSPAKKDKQVD
jgi:3-oxoacyl-ACP reductase-like protein